MTQSTAISQKYLVGLEVVEALCRAGLTEEHAQVEALSLAW